MSDRGGNGASIIWDLGGTLLDTYPDVDRALARAAFRDRTEVSPRQIAEVAQLTRVSSAHALDVLSARHGVPRQVLQTAYGQVAVQWREHPPPAMAGAREVMDAVRADGGVNLVATHRDAAGARMLLDAAGLEVEDLVCAPDGFARKPDPQMLRVLIARHRPDPARVLAVGDLPVDVDAARAAGVPVVLLETPGIRQPMSTAPRITRLVQLLDMPPLSARR
ncbi:HAD-IA family hydrolase [Brachybacterium halotolerans subsp. kimchii]|uniref:HAD-IA family hydrolase n=1 Tax=Brachybacterium halotolerans TaxID=2795215 RepID=UPI001E4FF28A|nr:HAD-IA family hydrolase [Brachybacterium halotolerans]UEJ83218.1 HAD-IA family hydrolase [Brachybacterium halotolerans subsp. kimchii]